LRLQVPGAASAARIVFYFSTFEEITTAMRKDYLIRIDLVISGSGFPNKNLHGIIPCRAAKGGFMLE
jgi:hypothetical protein